MGIVLDGDTGVEHTGYQDGTVRTYVTFDSNGGLVSVGV